MYSGLWVRFSGDCFDILPASMCSLDQEQVCPHLHLQPLISGRREYLGVAWGCFEVVHSEVHSSLR